MHFLLPYRPKVMLMNLINLCLRFFSWVPPPPKQKRRWQWIIHHLIMDFLLNMGEFSIAILVFRISPCNLFHFVANEKAANPGANWWILVTQLLGNVGCLVCPIDQLRLKKGPKELRIVVFIATLDIQYYFIIHSQVVWKIYHCHTCWEDYFGFCISDRLTLFKDMTCISLVTRSLPSFASSIFEGQHVEMIVRWFHGRSPGVGRVTLTCHGWEWPVTGFVGEKNVWDK